jgi:hypothetical protein
MTDGDIGELPDVVNPKRRARAADDFRFYCEAYFPAAFYMPWSPDHHRVFGKIERAVRTGGLIAHAMPRDSGKTSITTVASVWAMVYDWWRFVALAFSFANFAGHLIIKPQANKTLDSQGATSFPHMLCAFLCPPPATSVKNA